MVGSTISCAKIGMRARGGVEEGNISRYGAKSAVFIRFGPNLDRGDASFMHDINA